MEESEVQYHPQSYADPRGRVFFRDGRCFRRIYPEWEDFYRKFILSDCFRSLVQDGLLIDTWIAQDGGRPTGLVLEHKHLSVASYPYEWCFEALKDCALLILDLQERLILNGLSLHDGHPFNVMFDACRPVFIDFSSINYKAADGGAWSALNEFKVNLLNPLRLMAHGQTKIPRAILCRDQVLTDEETEPLLARPRARWNIFRKSNGDAVRENSRVLSNRSLSERSAQTTATLRRRIEELEYSAAATEWSDYYADEFLPLDLRHYDRAKMQGVRDVLIKHKPRQVLDVASNRGWFAQLAASLGAQVVAFDLDEMSMNLCYSDCKKNGANVHPLVMNLTNPSPGIGIMNKGFPSALVRFRSEMVLALAIVHHLVFTSQLRFEQIVGTLNELTKNLLLVEFIPKDDVHINQRWTPDREWYTLDNFKAELKRHFRSIVEMESDPHPRMLLLCER